MNKKAQIFTVIAIMVLMLMFVSFEVFSIINQRDAIETRVSSMDSMLHSIEVNLERQLYIAGFRGIFVALEEIRTSGQYISDIHAFINETFFNGTVNGVNNSILYGTTYSDMINSINSKARKINVEVEMKNASLELSQEDPWNVKLVLTSEFLMEDREGLAQWNKTQIISTKISITSFEDPIYMVNLAPRKINQTLYEGNYVYNGDVTNLTLHLNGQYYTQHDDAPSFLQRIEGNLSADPEGNGIESFVRFPDEDKTAIDFIYFSPTNNPSPTHSVWGMPAWFRIDDAHVEKYQVSSLTGK